MILPYLESIYKNPAAGTAGFLYKLKHTYTISIIDPSMKNIYLLYQSNLNN